MSHMKALLMSACPACAEGTCCEPAGHILDLFDSDAALDAAVALEDEDDAPTADDYYHDRLEDL